MWCDMNTADQSLLTPSEMNSFRSLLPYMNEFEKRKLASILSASNQTLFPKPSSPIALGELAWPRQWQSPKHLLILNEALMKVANRSISRLLITMPPRHGKSMMTSEVFPAWYLGHHPDHRLMLASYEADFAADWGRKARGLLAEFGAEHFGIKISAESSAAKHWEIAGHRGGMVTAGVGGAMTGKGAHVLIIDDPIKNAEEANSFIMRQKVWDWYLSTAYTRLEPDGAAIVIQTRWHDDDLAGRLLKAQAEEGDQWTVIDFPAIALENDGMGREPGEPLWPNRYDRERLAKIEETVGPYVWSSLYQQQPPTKQGKIFDPAWFRYYEMRGDHYRMFNSENVMIGVVNERECERLVIVDCAGTSEEEAKERKGKPPSDTVVSTFDYNYRTGCLFWRDCAFGKWSFPQVLDQIRAAYLTHKPAWIGIEDEKTGHAALQTLTNLPVRPISHDGKDKLARSARAQNQLRTGKVFLDRLAAWRKPAVSQLTEWTGLQDERIDIGDTLFYACLHAGMNAGGRVIVLETDFGGKEWG